jgi:hypothetical protein
MSLVNCKECGARISTDAKSCPKCGARAPKRTSAFTKLAAVVLIPSCVALIHTGNKQEEEAAQARAAAEAAKTPEQRADEAAARKKLDAQTAVAIVGAKALRSAMKSPDSFDAQSVLLMPDGATCYEYTAVNAFGVKMKGAAVLANGKLLVQENDGNALVAAWNKACTKSGGREIKYLI